MSTALVVSGSEKGLSSVADLLKTMSFTGISVSKSGSEARRMLLENDYSLIIINTPLSDEFGHDLALTAVQDTLAGAILMVKSEIADEVAARVESAGVLVVPKPAGHHVFYQAIKLVTASQRRIAGLKNENMKLQNKIEEMRLVDRAKCVLIQYLKMTEPQAHRYIEKQAMDMRVTKREIALSILKTYET